MEPQNYAEAQKREENLTKTFWKLAHAKRAVSLVQTTCDLYLEHVENEHSPLHIPRSSVQSALRMPGRLRTMTAWA